MSDKAMIIILAVINFLIWFVAMDFIIATRKTIMSIEKTHREFILKCNEYWHNTFQDINKMVQMNVGALQHFSEQISAKMSNEGINDEAKDRE